MTPCVAAMEFLRDDDRRADAVVEASSRIGRPVAARLSASSTSRLDAPLARSVSGGARDRGRREGGRERTSAEGRGGMKTERRSSELTDTGARASSDPRRRRTG
jgi:hypothetical protein